MNCTNKLCSLQYTCQHPCIMGVGDPHADLILIGEAPGMNEDMRGRPFVGEAGKLLNHILYKLGLDRESIYLTNVIKCRPPRNTLPKREELSTIWEACWPLLEQELQEVDPKVVVLMGATALNLVSGVFAPRLTKMESMEIDTVYEGAKTIVAFHPAYVLRSPSKEANLGRALFKAARIAGLKPKPKGLEAGLYEYEIRS